MKVGTKIPELSEIAADESDVSNYSYYITGFASDLSGVAQTWTEAANAVLKARAKLAKAPRRKTA